ncbi:DUF6011 domain-containing protein [Streptomyces sp. NBC_00669]|uniref:DUF6011 domain-containing protein n=1 Tax=unclassified Streptomyces TaxID=2593676 RepID=UPI002E354957|nr:DUF6011 domain-containing protein [Streptomyces sp. NBC_00669]
MPSDAPLPGLATDEELAAAGRRVVLCGMCGHPLSDAESRAWGLGENCRRKLGGNASVRRPGRFEVDQEGIPGL